VTSAIFADVFSDAMPLKNFERFRTDSLLRNCFSKKNSIASESPLWKKKGRADLTLPGLVIVHYGLLIKPLP
jgi:hypothetical protein